MKTDRAAPRTVDEYLAGLPGDVRKVLEQVRTAIRRAAPEAQESIRYQIPTFEQGGPLVHFAAHARHVGFYPTPSGIERFQAELSAYEGAKGSVRFPLDQPMPLELIGRIVRFRVEENLSRAASRPRAPAGKKAGTRAPARARGKRE
ncbi:MAG TPA: DUF1801 domain-containing protein [Gemmatimonadales bacterium]|nr:DUF1801 domain-containing protein [Gemmatimonadales bacterium]